MKLWWMRHAKAEAGSIDKIRNLTDFGREQALKVAEYIAKSKQTPVKIYASTYNRAQQTAQIIAERLGLEMKILRNITPEDNVKFALAHLEIMQEDSLIVTHQPLWSLTLAELLQEQTYRNPPTAALAVLSGDIFVSGALVLEDFVERLK